MNHAEAKQKIQQLIDKYEAAKQAGQLKSYTEEDTKKDFILPLFSALGWDVHDRNQVTSEENISGDRVDYGFYLNGRIKFYLEAKPLKADLYREQYAKQAISYAWNKGITWTVLTDFENLIIFNALSPEKSLHGKKYLDISCNDFLNRFDELCLLSKDAFEKDLLDKQAEKHGKKLQKVFVTEKLAQDLNYCRKILSKAFSTWNENISSELIDEGVQKLIDRLIFIRVAEDRKIEPPILRPLIHQWKSSGKAGATSPYQAMVGKFRELDKVYNSNLFSEHPFEQWGEFSGKTEEVVEMLYGDKDYFEYDFSAIPADVLGAVYENYLGYKLEQSKEDLSAEDLPLAKNRRKRKEQGIYYTPRFIVDYIVDNALGSILDKCLTVNDLQKIRVLDPACGSGSFLIAAFNKIVKKYESFGANPNSFLKIQILLNNIYGVDLDSQAIELARLNLLLQVCDSQIKLPNLEGNIKNGNSLISGTDEELENYFGKNYRDKKPFNWQEEFPEVFNQGGFDCVIGNPPWGADIDEDSKFLGEKYPDSTKAYKDIYKIFIDKAIQLLKPSGSLGFIAPNTFLYQPRYEDIKKVVDEYENYVINLGEHIFGHVQLPSSILILQKEKGTNLFVVDLTQKDRISLPSELSAVTRETGKVGAQATSGIIKHTGLTFDDIFYLKDAGVQYASVGAGKAGKGKSDLPERIFSDKKDKIFGIPFYTGSNIARGGWHIDDNIKSWFRSSYKDVIKQGEWVHFTKDVFESDKKIIWRQTADTIHAALMNFSAYFGKTIHAGLIKEKYQNKISYEYALAIFNSQYIRFAYRQKVKEVGKVFPQVKLKYLKPLPFVIGTKVQQKKLSDLAKRMIELQKELHRSAENSEKWHKLKTEIERTDKKIDEEVYKLYGLSEEEIKIVEGVKVK